MRLYKTSVGNKILNIALVCLLGSYFFIAKNTKHVQESTVQKVLLVPETLKVYSMLYFVLYFKARK